MFGKAFVGNDRTSGKLVEGARFNPRVRGTCLVRRKTL